MVVVLRAFDMSKEQQADRQPIQEELNLEEAVAFRKGSLAGRVVEMVLVLPQTLEWVGVVNVDREDDIVVELGVMFA